MKIQGQYHIETKQQTLAHLNFTENQILKIII